jgi:hypothetical protein
MEGRSMAMVKSGLLGVGLFVVFLVLYIVFGLRSRLGVPSSVQYMMDIGTIKTLTIYSFSFWAALVLSFFVGFLIVNFARRVW